MKTRICLNQPLKVFLMIQILSVWMLCTPVLIASIVGINIAFGDRWLNFPIRIALILKMNL